MKPCLHPCLENTIEYIQKFIKKKQGGEENQKEKKREDVKRCVILIFICVCVRVLNYDFIEQASEWRQTDRRSIWCQETWKILYQLSVINNQITDDDTL